jgi:K+-transporting ATPase ATPase C chain
MKNNIFQALRLSFVLLIILAVAYPVLIFGFAQFSPNRGKGLMVKNGDKTYYENIGQSFKEDRYFQSRPSAVDYNAAGSGGSNKGPGNPEYLKTVNARIDTLLLKNPGLKLEDIPADLITASGSGLDPDISIQAAKIQVKRIAAVRKIKEEKILALLEKNTEKPLFGIFGPEKINVLKLNIDLDTL